MGYCGEFSGVGSWVRSDLVGLGRLYEICLSADRQLALMPVGLLATILPYPIFRLLFSSGKGKVEPRNTGNQYYQQKDGVRGEKICHVEKFQIYVRETCGESQISPYLD